MNYRMISYRASSFLSDALQKRDRNPELYHLAVQRVTGQQDLHEQETEEADQDFYFYQVEQDEEDQQDYQEEEDEQDQDEEEEDEEDEEDYQGDD